MSPLRRSPRRSPRGPRRRFAFLLALAVLGLASLALARDRSDLVITTGDGDHATIRIDGRRIEVVTIEDGETSVHAVELGSVLDEVFIGLDEALGDLRDRGISVRMEEGLLTVEEGDRACTVDVQTMASELSGGLREMMRGLQRELDGARVVLDGDERTFDAEQLRDELDALRNEVDRLRDDLQRLR